MEREIKPCPFCGCELEKHHACYKAYRGGIVEYDYWDHPMNDCVLSSHLSDVRCLSEQDLEAWNRRAVNVW